MALRRLSFRSGAEQLVPPDGSDASFCALVITLSRGFSVAFTTDARGAATGVAWAAGSPRERQAPRVAPLPSTLQPRTDPDPALAARISAAFAALREGGAALASAADVAPGPRKAFERGSPSLADFAGATYLGEEDVTGRGIRRHGSEVARVRLYRMRTQRGDSYVMVHLTAAGVVADFDVVRR